MDVEGTTLSLKLKTLLIASFTALELLNKVSKGSRQGSGCILGVSKVISTHPWKDSGAD